MDVILWVKILDFENLFRCQLIDQVVFIVLLESKSFEQVLVIVKVFMFVNLLNEFIELLEKIVF